MSVVRHEAEINRALILASPPGHPVGDVEVTWFSDGSIRLELMRDEVPLTVERLEWPPGGGLDVWVKP